MFLLRDTSEYSLPLFFVIKFYTIIHGGFPPPPHPQASPGKVQCDLLQLSSQIRIIASGE